MVTSGQVKLKTGTPLIIDNKRAASRTAPIRRRRKSESAHMNFTDLFIPQAGARDNHQSPDPGAGRALAERPVRSPVPQDAERGRNGHAPPTTAPTRQTVAGFITQPLEGAIAQAQGIDYMSSTSVIGVSDDHRRRCA